MQFIENFGELPNLRTKPIFHVSNANIDPKQQIILKWLKIIFKNYTRIIHGNWVIHNVITTIYKAALKN